MASEHHEFHVFFTRSELESLAQDQCKVPLGFITADVTCRWKYLNGHFEGLDVAFTTNGQVQPIG